MYIFHLAMLVFVGAKFLALFPTSVFSLSTLISPADVERFQSQVTHKSSGAVVVCNFQSQSKFERD